MGATKTKRSERKQRGPWELVAIRTRKGTTIRVNCPACRTRTAVRYWHPEQSRGVCFDCVPREARHLLRRQPDSAPDSRPMALG